MEKDCLFCNKEQVKGERSLENEFFYSIIDAFGVSKGHTIIIPNKHLEKFEDLSSEELIRLSELLRKIKSFLKNKFSPDGFNIGINEGKEAGQTIFHLHVHIIPRYKGDVKNPIGGVRNIIPGKGDYLKI